MIASCSGGSAGLADQPPCPPKPSARGAMSGRSVMIMAAPDGARRTKCDRPAIPLSGQEIAAEAAACARAGAAALHLHVRNNDNRHTINPDACRLVPNEVRAVMGDDPVIQITSESAGVYSPPEQMDMVRRVRPEAVSPAMTGILPPGGDEARVTAFPHWPRRERIAPRFIVFGADEPREFLSLRAKGVVPFAEPFLLFVLGRHNTARESEPADLPPFLDALGGVALPRSMRASGRNEAACVKAAIRPAVGFENNPLRPDGTPYVTNREVVRSAADAVAAPGREVMPVAGTRDLLARAVA